MNILEGGLNQQSENYGAAEGEPADLMFNDEDPELRQVNTDLEEIEQVIDAEKKRREESNQIMKEFIVEYLQDLESSIANKVDGQFNELKNRVDKID